MRILLAAVALVAVTATMAVAYDTSRCGGRYSDYPDWAREAFCKPPNG